MGRTLLRGANLHGANLWGVKDLPEERSRLTHGRASKKPWGSEEAAAPPTKEELIALRPERDLTGADLQ